MTTTTTTTTTARGPVDRWIEIPPSRPARPSGSGEDVHDSQSKRRKRYMYSTELKRVRPCAPGRPHEQEVRHDV